ncbi:carboxynorspermidine decarboxylase [Teredinibacter waterburyi]|jgi:carboxynorspermidine decarboxylase (EC 4.1.1.-)|uniref:carboxynorspermidine decarboxylase n=1 Tax=Teredinibacter waterburyi TaxID=1500538 RepID=UPI001660001B|nr:carboxynorspermidine decarboxylase [Teredinibacter waterburyi]
MSQSPPLFHPHQQSFGNFDPYSVPSPCYVVDEVAVEKNLQILARVQNESGAKVLLALKAFSMFSLAPLVMRYLNGVCASGLNEAKLGREEFNREVHTYAAAFRPEEFDEIAGLSDHLVFNSVNQWNKYRTRALELQRVRSSGQEQQSNKSRTLELGLRINPEHSEGETPMYDPCAPCSRMGIPAKQLDGVDLTGISGIHFHTLCEQNFAPLARTLDAVEAKFGHLLGSLKWVNFGGGHHITRADYDVDGLIERIRAFSVKYDVQVYIEPGEAIALNTGVFVAEVLDTLHNRMDLAILDTSATCHMPDVLEMPYRPRITGAGEPGEKEATIRLGGPSCLAGDVIGDYSFDAPLAAGQRLMFEDMAIYTMVKNTTFNGINLPSIAIYNSDSNEVRVVKNFGYQDFKQRLS